MTGVRRNEGYSTQEADLLRGVKIGQPDLTGGQLFKDNTKTLTW